MKKFEISRLEGLEPSTSRAVIWRSNPTELQAHKTRREGDSNPRYKFTLYGGLAIRWFKPLTHLSKKKNYSIVDKQIMADELVKINQ